MTWITDYLMINREEQKSVSPKRFCLSVTQKHTPAHWLYFFLGGGGGGWMPCVGEGRGCMSTTILFIFLNSAPWLISLLPPGAFLSPSHTKKWNFPCCISVHLNHLNTIDVTDEPTGLSLALLPWVLCVGCTQRTAVVAMSRKVKQIHRKRSRRRTWIFHH